MANGEVVRQADGIAIGMAAPKSDRSQAERDNCLVQKTIADSPERAGNKVQERLNEALKRAVARIESEPRDVEAIVSHLGWGGRHLRNGNGLDAPPGSEPENIKQIVDRAIGRLRESGFVPDAVEQSIALAERSLPILEWDLCAALLKAKLCFVRFSCDALASAAATFRKEPPFESVRIGPVEGLVKAGTSAAINELATSALELMRSRGCANILELWDRARELFGPNTTLAFVEAIARTVARFEWLDRENGWFWYRPESIHSQNRLVGLIKRVVAAAPSIQLGELRAAIRRDYRLGTFAPPLGVMANICKRLLFLQVSETTVTRVASSLQWNGVLGPQEAILAGVLQAHGPLLARDRLLELCRDRGVDENTFAEITSHSAILKTDASGMYALVGTAIPGPEPASGVESRGETAEIADHGCLPDGRVFLAWRLASSSFQSGALRVPEPLSTFVEGGYKLETFAGCALGDIQIRRRACSDLRRLLECERAEIGDTLAMVLDSRDRRAAGIIGAENVIAAVKSGYLALGKATADKRDEGRVTASACFPFAHGHGALNH